MSKYYVSWHTEIIAEKKSVLVDINFVNEKDKFTSKEIIALMKKLDIYWKPFDNDYGKYDILRIAHNEDYEIGFIYSHKANAVYLSIRCYSASSYLKLIDILEDLKVQD
jgi:hypothetical protein